MSLRFPSRRFLIPCVLILGSQCARADVIYTNFGTDGGFSVGTGLIVTHDGIAGSSVAVAFTPSADFNLSSIEFAASVLSTNDAGSMLGIFADDAGRPAGSSMESFRLDGLLGQFGLTVPVVTLTSSLQPLLLADTLYWIGMQGPAGGFIVWNQNTSLAGGFLIADGSGNWSASDGAQGVVEIDGFMASRFVSPGANPADVSVIAAQAFTQSLSQVEETSAVIPEPGAFWLMATGLLGIVCVFSVANKESASRTHQKQ